MPMTFAAWLLAQTFWAGVVEVCSSMVCPNCGSIDLKKASLLHAAGLYESRGGIRGFFLGNRDGLAFGRYRGTSQSRLSAMAAPPGKLPYLTPAIVWLAGFFVVMAFAGRGRLSWMAGFLAVAYILMLPAYLLAGLLYNYVLRSKKYRSWEGALLCQRCGAFTQEAVSRIADQK